MTAINHAITAALLHFVWEGMLVALLLWVTLAALRNGSARLRYVVSCAALAVMSALPVLTTWVVYRAPIAASTQAAHVPDAPDSTALAGLPAAGWLSAWAAMLEPWALPVWFMGVMIFAVRLIWATRAVTTLRRKGDPAEPSVIAIVSRLAQRMNVHRPVRVLISKLIDSPSLVGWVRPVILLPAATLLNLTVEQLESVLAHEVAHVRRHDYLVNVLQNVVETLLFYQPAVWWVSSRIRRERELCCDDLVVETCGDAVGYARALAKLERLRAISPELAMSSTAGPLLYRIQRLTGTTKEHAPSKVPAMLSLGLALLCLMTNVQWPAYAQPQSSREAVVHRDAIWVDTVKYGDMPVLVRATGTLTTSGTAELKVAESQASLVQNGQAATLDLRRGITIAGKVARVDSYVSSGSVTVLVDLQAPAPEFTGQSVDGVIRVKTLKDVIHVGRPVAPSAGESALFKVEADGSHAARVKVRFGAQSVNTVQVLEGLQPGDRVILSDTTKFDSSERVRLQ
jgi:beta-lactamase regulating signal transducer with metallopeptidase domain